MEKNILLSLEETHETLKRLKTYDNVTSNETFVMNISSMFLNGLSHFSDFLSNTMGDIEKEDTKIMSKLFKDTMHLKKKINDLRNKDISNAYDAMIPVYIGMDKTVLDVITEIIIDRELVLQNLIENISETDTFVAKLLTSKDNRLQLSPMLFDYDPFESNEKLEKLLIKIVDKNSMEDRKRLSDLYDNMDGIIKSFDIVDKLDIVTSTKLLSSVNSKVNTLHKRVNVLHKYLNNNPDTKISKNILSSLIDNLDNLAKYLTTAMAIVHISNQLANTMRHSVNALEKYSK